VCRLLVPFLLGMMLAASWLSSGAAYQIFGGLQVCGYLLGVSALLWPALGKRFRPAEVARSVLVLSAATLAAFVNFLTGNYFVWAREAAAQPKTSGVQAKEAH
jgi:peptidoglycan/LPS O-acetylase OafA/YrhL